MKMKQKKENNPYHHCLELEMALLEFFGEKSRWVNSAGTFSDVKYVKKAIQSAAKKIRTRLKEIITVDDRLLLTTSSAIEAIERSLKNLDINGNGLLEILAHFINLIANLLGYDWQRGKHNRQILFFQTIKQQMLDDVLRYPHDTYKRINAVEVERVKIVEHLFDHGKRILLISRILNLSETRVKDILVRAGKINRVKNIKEA
ncbi:MAG: hypothetical protein ACUZ8E_05505 [Candidatus Anammoxibacter sp.]